ncbi:Apoptosis inhibitor 5 [Heterocephalus glaber]|uniref:Apoptosis inhibitor 5 n=1 Tax=Heterocephalus glaber TaxID=10181 RepID=G5B7S3_HETGA|nr:Apoptosis inhibitor 5 [Heterocephalus glaber]
MPTMEELYHNYAILADATEQVGQHKDAYQVILDGGKTGEALKTEENKIKAVALKITNNINVFIKDLFHIPPSYKSTVTLSWKPEQKVEIRQKRANEDTTSGSPPKKSTAGPKRDARQIYNPPSGKYSSNLSNFTYERSLRGSRGG